MRELRHGDRQDRAAGAEVERVARPLAAHDAVDRLEAAGGGAVMAGAEGKPGLDLDGDGADMAQRAVMPAMHEEPAGPYRLQAFQRARHPVDVGQRLAFERELLAEPSR